MAIRHCAMLLLGLLAGPMVPAAAAELTVLSAGAITGPARAVIPGFEGATGITVTLHTDTVGILVRQLTAGEPFDVVLMSPAGLAELEKIHRIVPDSVVALARVGIGVGIRAGQPRPDIGTVEAFKAMLLSARAIAYVDPASGGTSGIYLSNLFHTLGIADAMASKSVLVRGGLAAATLVDGRADIALQQISEIIGFPDVTLVGPLPAAIQAYTTYAGAIGAAAQQPDAARRFLAAMQGQTARAAMAERGMTLP